MQSIKPYIILQGGQVRWRLNKKSPKEFKLKSISGISILNPLAYFNDYVKFSVVGKEHIEQDNLFFIQCKGVILKNNSRKDIDLDKLINQISHLLRMLRNNVLQHDLDYLDFWASLNVDSLKKHSGLKADWASGQIAKIGKEYKIRRDLFETSCTWEDLKKTDKQISKGEPIHIYNEILLDAKSALRVKDFKKSIIYLCIACESFISTLLNERYQLLKSKNKLKYKLIVDASETKDPIYALLNKNDHFTTKIHETSLYLLNKSLLIGNKKLYDDINKLYKTRNQIVHYGDISKKSEDYLTIDEKGAKKALDDTLEFFKWFDNPRDQISPEIRFMD